MLRTRSFAFSLVTVACLLHGSVVRAGGVDPSKATAMQREQAQARFARGRDRFGAKRYDEALGELRASLDIVASPNTRLYVARCLDKLNRAVEAYAEYGRAAVEARELTREDPRYEKAAVSAEAERAAVAARLAFVTVHVQNAIDSTSVRLGEDPLPRGAWGEPAPVAPGVVEVVAETPGRPTARTTITVAVQERREVDVDAGALASGPREGAAALAPSTAEGTSSPSGALRTWAYVSAGIGAAGFVTFAVAGSLANGTYDDLARQCGGAPCPPGLQGTVDRGRTQEAVANVGLGVGIVGVAAGATLFVLSLTASRGDRATPLSVAPTPTGLRVAGAF